ncbi:hypothetical protein MLD38_031138 [Melastoma candidum]|uniref:Uncharacterized protein n=1 Tax=Melastoma candidum TaxID=119954 RepID=A0ACB9MPC2_9MYRT|nr:hypothetical protein MLD38_031138 [Melastoma candidum]
MFVKKLVEKASRKPAGTEGFKCVDVEPGIVFHYGIPPGCSKFGYDSIQSILAVSTKEGRIKLLGKDNTQILLESQDIGVSKFLQFVENEGLLLSVTFRNQLEVWDIDRRTLCCVYDFKEPLTSLNIISHTLYIYAGSSRGNVSILNLVPEQRRVIQMKYSIPFAVSHGYQGPSPGDAAVMFTLPQPLAESKRILILYEDGVMVLWEIQESKAIFTGGVMLSGHHEQKQVTSACWACPLGSKVAIGYSTGDIFVWSIPAPKGTAEAGSESSSQTIPLCKFNLGYKLDKVPIGSLKWIQGDGKASRLYVMGSSDTANSNPLQVLLMSSASESRIVKLVLPLPEPCISMEITSTYSSKQKPEILVVLGKSGRMYAYDDSLIENYLLQCQSRSAPSLPKEIPIKMPFVDSAISTSVFITNNLLISDPGDEEYAKFARKVPPLLLCNKFARTGINMSTNVCGGLSEVKNLYITGHSNGTIKFWDISCPIPLPIFSMEQQSDGNSSLGGVAVTALNFDVRNRILVTGDKDGVVRIYELKSDSYNSGIMKRGSNSMIKGMKVVKVNGAVLSLVMNNKFKHLAVGSQQGYVSLIDMDGPTKNILVFVTRDSSVSALDCENGNPLSTSMVHPKKPSQALFMEILDGNPRDVQGTPFEDAVEKQEMLLLCSQKAVYIYSLSNLVQGVKKVLHKKKLQSSCCWASMFYSPDAGLILLFTDGRIQIRSLPELTLIRETEIRGYPITPTELNPSPDGSICSSHDGQVVMVNKDQDIMVFAIMLPKSVYRLRDSLGQVYRKDLIFPEENFSSNGVAQKQKPKGLFSSLMRDSKADREKHPLELEREDRRERTEALSKIFSTENFPCDSGNVDKIDNPIQCKEDVSYEGDADMNIDDIDLDDFEAKPKGNNVLAGLNKKMLTSKLQNIKGKLKNIKIKMDNNDTEKEHQQSNEMGTVDQIKRKYGVSMSTEVGAAKMAQNKLLDNLGKLQGISHKTAEMQDTAKSFSSMAQELRRSAEQEKRGFL